LENLGKFQQTKLTLAKQK